jgi:hypothetical protein
VQRTQELQPIRKGLPTANLVVQRNIGHPLLVVAGHLFQLVSSQFRKEVDEIDVVHFHDVLTHHQLHLRSIHGVLHWLSPLVSLLVMWVVAAWNDQAAHHASTVDDARTGLGSTGGLLALSRDDDLPAGFTTPSDQVWFHFVNASDVTPPILLAVISIGIYVPLDDRNDFRQLCFRGVFGNLNNTSGVNAG